MAVFLRTLTRRRSKRQNLFIFTLILIYIVWVEFLALQFKSLFWKLPHKKPSAVQILLVADPQLIGYRNEKPAIGWLSRWDSDRYLQHAFSKAYNKVKPEYVAFLGDLFDEGVNMESNGDKEFEWTLERFRLIYQMENATSIYIPGDNDIGGERELVSLKLKERFQRSFPNKINKSLMKKGDRKLLDFSEMNIFEESKIEKISEGDGLKILLSHVPVIRSLSSMEKVFGNYKPDLILSAHDHTAEFYVKKPQSQQFTRHEAYKGLRFSVSTGMPLVEIQVPTTSYRMGVPSMAFGLLTIDYDLTSRSYTIGYENLWLVGRYPQLYGYIFLILFVFLYNFAPYFSFLWRWTKIDVCLRKCRSGGSVKPYVLV